jgi:hypothetical protein
VAAAGQSTLFQQLSRLAYRCHPDCSLHASRLSQYNRSVFKPGNAPDLIVFTLDLSKNVANNIQALGGKDSVTTYPPYKGVVREVATAPLWVTHIVDLTAFLLGVEFASSVYFQTWPA